MNRKIPVVRIVILVMMWFALFSVTGSIEAAVMDDVAVMSLNDPGANRAMIVYEDSRGSLTVASYAVLGLVGVWTVVGFKKKVTE